MTLFHRKAKNVALDLTALKAIVEDVKAKADEFIAAVPAIVTAGEADLAKAEADVNALVAELASVRDTLAANNPVPANPATPAV